MKKLISLLMALLMVATVITGCGDKAKEKGKEEQTQEQGKSADKKGKEDKPQAKERTDMGYNENVKAVKIGSIDSLGDVSLSTKNYAPYYMKDDKYGFVSFDGSYDSGAVYTRLDYSNGYYIVSTKEFPETPDDIASLNAEGLVDIYGNEIIEQKYAMLEVLNDRFVRLVEATGVAENEDESVFYTTSNMYSLGAADGDTRYKANWYIYDLKEDKMIDAISGNYPTRLSAKGNIITYYDENGATCIVDAKGNAIENVDIVFTDGTYRTRKTGNNYVMYDTDGKELFKYTSDDYFVSSLAGNGTYTAYKDDTYFVVGSNGEKISADFEKNISVYNGVVVCDKKIYKLDGTPISDKSFTTTSADDFFDDVILCEGDGMIYMFKNDGTMLCEVEKTDGVYAHSTGFTITGKKDNKNKMYCMKDKDFTLDYYTTGRWFGIADDGDKETVYSAINGEKLISGYDKYVHAWDGNGNVYIYAYNKDGAVDVYQLI